jgi:hypothetical protein
VYDWQFPIHMIYGNLEIFQLEYDFIKLCMWGLMDGDTLSVIHKQMIGVKNQS